MNTPTVDQVKGALDRILIAVVTFVVSKGYITPSQAAEWTTNLIPLALAVAGAVYGWYVNRPKAIMQSAAALPNTLVITTAAMANDTPDQKNIISNASSKEAIATAVATAKVV